MPSKECVEDVIGVEIVLEPPLRVRIPLTLTCHGLRVFVTKLVVVRTQVGVGQTLEGFGHSWQGASERGFVGGSKGRRGWVGWSHI